MFLGLCFHYCIFLNFLSYFFFNNTYLYVFRVTYKTQANAIKNPKKKKKLNLKKPDANFTRGRQRPVKLGC